MELLDYQLKVKDYKRGFTIHLFTDIHRAAPGCDVLMLRRDIRKLREANEAGEQHVWIGGGDWSNGIGPKDKRFDSSAVHPDFHKNVGKDLFQAEARSLAREFESIAPYGIGLGMGNHEASVAKNNEFNPAQDVAERLNLPFLGYSALIRLRWALAPPKKSAGSLLIYWHHGRGAARTYGSRVNTMYAMRDTADADIYLTGHDHTLMDFHTVRLTGRRKGKFSLVRKDMIFVNGGTYLKAYPAESKVQTARRFNVEHEVHADYAEIKGYTPTVIGHNGVKIHISTCSAKTAQRHSQDSWDVRLEKVNFQ